MTTLASTTPSAPVPVAANPYVGPRPFTAAERDRFFGRDREANQLIPLVIAERIVLFYAESGAGKSSLINAKLIPGLEERNFKMLLGRLSGQAAESSRARNIYIYNLLLSLEHCEDRSGPGPTPAQMEQMTLAEYLADLEIEPASGDAGAADSDGGRPVPLDAPQIIGGVRPLALIIDQFEELFTTNPGAWAQRGPFFEQLCQAMDADPYLWVVLAIREDYIASLDPYVDLLPGRLRARFYMQRMDHDTAMEAVCRPVAALRPFEPDAAEELVRNLSLITVGRSADGKPVYEPGPNIEPVQLQVVCYQLWEELKQHPGESITLEDLHGLAKGQDLAGFISDALGNFYEQALHEVLHLYPDVTERRLRGWFSRELITEAETRSAVRQGKTSTGQPPNDLPNPVVSALQDRFIVRAEIRGENTWYELSHDRFVGSILQANRAWSARNPRVFQAAARAWDEAGRQPDKLYEGKQLQAALARLKDHPEELTETEEAFIQASQAHAAQAQTRRRNIIYALVTVLVLVLLGLFVISSLGWAQARQQTTVAEAARQQEAEQRGLAVTALAAANTAQAKEAQQRQVAEEQRQVADQQRQLADEQRATAQSASIQAVDEARKADQARATAVAAKAVAEVASKQAQSSRLASLSDYFRLTKPDLGLLLAVQSAVIKDNWETRHSLLDSLQNGLKNQLNRQGSSVSTEDSPTALVFNPQGDLLAGGLNNGQVLLLSVEGHGRNRVPTEFNSSFPVKAVAFNADGSILAAAGGDRSVRLWDQAKNTVSSFQPFGTSGSYASIRALAFQPQQGGLLLAVGSEKLNDLGQVWIYTGTKQNLTLDCGNANCSRLAWSPDGKRLAVGSSTGEVSVFDVQQSASGQVSAKEIWQQGRAHTGNVTGLAWYKEGQRLVTSGIDQRIIQWNVETGEKLIVSDPKDTPIILDLAMSDDRRFLVAGSSQSGKTVTLWDADTLKRLDYSELTNAHDMSVPAVAYNPRRGLFASAGLDNYLLFWNFSPVDPLSRVLWTISASGRTEALMDTGEQLLAAQTVANNLNLWGPPAAATPAAAATPVAAATKAPAATPAAQAAAAKPATAATPQPKDAVKLQTLAVQHSAAALGRVDGKTTALLGTFDGQVRFIDPASGDKGKDVRDPVRLGKTRPCALALSADGKWAAGGLYPDSGGDCTQLALVDLSANPAGVQTFDLKQLAASSAAEPANPGAVASLAFDQAAKRLAIGTTEGKIFFFDLAAHTLDPLVTEGMSLSTVKLIVTSLAFSKDDVGLLAAGFKDGRVALWETASKSPVGTFNERANSEVSGLVFVQDAQAVWNLVSASTAGEIRIWSIDKSAWYERACQMAGRVLTDEERARFLLDPNAKDPCAE